MTGAILSDDEKRRIAGSLRALAQSHIEADFGSGIGGAAQMRRIEKEAAEQLRFAGIKPSSILGASQMREFAAAIEKTLKGQK